MGSLPKKKAKRKCGCRLIAWTELKWNFIILNMFRTISVEFSHSSVKGLKVSQQFYVYVSYAYCWLCDSLTSCNDMFHLLPVVWICLHDLVPKAVRISFFHFAAYPPCRVPVFRVCCCMVRRAPARRCWLAPSPITPSARSSASPAQNSYRSSSAKGRAWSESCSSWPGTLSPPYLYKR